MAGSPVRGRSDRIALIHAVYAAAWSGITASAHAPPAATIPLLGAALVVALIAAVAWRRAPPPGDRTTGAAIRRINVATAMLVVAAIVAAHALGADRWIVPVVLAIMAGHFLPLWRLLHRRSMLVMAAALLIAACLPLAGAAPWSAAAAAAFAFVANAARLALAGLRH